jgi:Flp pilus assembly protein TadB
LTLVVLVILAALWAVVLLPPLLRSRTERTNDSIGDFNYRLDVLGRTNGALTPERRRVVPGQRAAKRRKDVARALVLAVGVTGLLALATNMTLLWALNVVADVALLSFVGLLVWARSMQAERAQKVRRLPARAQSDLALRRAASS